MATASRGVFGGVLFERNLNTFNWIGTVAIDTSFESFSLSLSDQYISNIILIDPTATSTEQRLQSNKNSFSLLPGWNISESVRLQTRWSSLLYSDAKDIGLSSASFNTLYGGARYDVSPGLVLVPMGGYRWDDQGGFRDQGPGYDFRAYTRPYVVLGEYQLSGDLRFNREDVDPRLLENHLARVGLQKTFFGSTRDSLEIQFTRTRREFYSLSGTSVPAVLDTNIDSRVDDILAFANLLDYEISSGLLSSFFIGVSNRTLDKDIRYIGTGAPETPQFGTQIGEFLLNAFVQAAYYSSDQRSFFISRFQYNERNETHAAKPLPGVSDALFRQANDTEMTKDNLTRRTILTGDMQFPLSGSDLFRFSGSASILRYDTPHEQNVEDRDEQLFSLGLTTLHTISQYVDLELSLRGSMNHVVYLASARSANNNTNRILRFAPRIEYRPTRGFVTSNSFEVLANYTVYDFEEQASFIRSFSYRQFGWIDSTIVPLTQTISLDFFVYLRLYERGQLRWDDFTERNESAFVDETYAVQFRYVPIPSLTFAVGIRYFSQTRYSFDDGERMFESRLKSLGPTCLIHWRANPYSVIGFSGWFEERRQTGGASRSLPNMTLNIQFSL
ncbi:MAG: hypothetical protein OEV30_00910 [Ignavibacteria bacterium]|nr:hypothetical protein [Ignavibacteria bacterium]